MLAIMLCKAAEYDIGQKQTLEAGIDISGRPDIIPRYAKLPVG
jgi:hypothetical protein